MKKILALATLAILFASLLISIKNQKLKNQSAIEQKTILSHLETKEIKQSDVKVKESNSSEEEPELPTSNASFSYMLESYASENSSPQDDIEIIASLLFSMKRELQGIDTRFLATNEDIVDLLTGSNPYKLKFLSKNASVFNDDKQLIDRWGSPYRFHLQSAKEIEIRSAGPDKEMFTEDDYLRAADGTFLNTNGSFKK